MGTMGGKDEIGMAVDVALQPLDVIADFLRKVTGAVPDDAQLAILRAGYEECR